MARRSLGSPSADPNQVMTRGQVQAGHLAQVGTFAAPLGDPATPRPTVPGAVYWIMASGVTPTNAVNGDLIWNA